MDLLRFITAGSIDDGKSTLTGRLLLDTNNIKADILDSISGDDGADRNLAFITDGLRAERQAGITIDVAYKYFTTPGRKYIITDAPGHFQYTKNLVTGASSVDVMIILIDAINGISTQTRRHSLVASFLGIAHIVVAVNKMDLLQYDEAVYNNIRAQFQEMAAILGLPHITYIPISALNGDNVTFTSQQMPWYSGTTLLQYLESCAPARTDLSAPMRFPVQYAAGNNYYGRLISGTMTIGDKITAYPAGLDAVIKNIIQNHTGRQQATAGEDICISLENNAVLDRGNLLADSNGAPHCAQEFEARICWLDETAPLTIDTEYILGINATRVPCRITAIASITDNETFIKNTGATRVSVNELATVTIKTASPIAFDPFSLLPQTGRGIIIDTSTNNTSGAFVIL